VDLVPVIAKKKPSGDLEHLYADSRLTMVRLAWLLSGSREVAEDVVQDAFIRIEPLLPQLRNPAGYLRRTVINGVAAHQRRLEIERRYQTRPEMDSIEIEVDELWSVVMKLPERSRHALVLRYYLDLSFKEIADLLDCPVGTAKSLVHRGLAHIREEIEP
jgi:RNA polymerase sigma factor (sigma-70 family)